MITNVKLKSQQSKDDSSTSEAGVGEVHRHLTHQPVNQKNISHKLSLFIPKFSNLLINTPIFDNSPQCFELIQAQTNPLLPRECFPIFLIYLRYKFSPRIKVEDGKQTEKSYVRGDIITTLISNILSSYTPHGYQLGQSSSIYVQ